MDVALGDGNTCYPRSEWGLIQDGCCSWRCIACYVVGGIEIKFSRGGVAVELTVSSWLLREEDRIRKSDGSKKSGSKMQHELSTTYSALKKIQDGCCSWRCIACYVVGSIEIKKSRWMLLLKMEKTAIPDVSEGWGVSYLFYFCLLNAALEDALHVMLWAA